MVRVLVVGIDPDLVDYTDPALPSGLNAEAVRAGVDRGLNDLRAAGHDPTHQYVTPDPADLGGLADHLRHNQYECVTVGGGVRLPPRNLTLFEAILNVIAASASKPAIALVSRPDEVAVAVARVLRSNLQ